MPLTMTDLYAHPAYQEAIAHSYAQQRAKNLAIAPQVNLSDLVRQDTTRQQALGQLGVAQGRLDLARDAHSREQSERPWAIGLGGLSLAGSLYGTYKGFKADERSETQAAELRQAYTNIGTQGQQQTAAITAGYQGIRDVMVPLQETLARLNKQHPMMTFTPGPVVGSGTPAAPNQPLLSPNAGHPLQPWLDRDWAAAR